MLFIPNFGYRIESLFDYQPTPSEMEDVGFLLQMCVVHQNTTIDNFWI